MKLHVSCTNEGMISSEIKADVRATPGLNKAEVALRPRLEAVKLGKLEMHSCSLPK